MGDRWKDYWKKEERLWKKNKDSILFLIGLSIAISGIYAFYIGFHNFDSAQNMIFIRDDIISGLLREDIDFDVGPYTEQTSGGQYIRLEDAYMMGVNQILTSILFLIVGFFMMGYYFSRIRDNV